MTPQESIVTLLKEQERIWKFFKDRCEDTPCAAMELAAGAFKAAGYVFVCKEALKGDWETQGGQKKILETLAAYAESRMGFDSPIFSQMILSAKKDAATELLALL